MYEIDYKRCYQVLSMIKGNGVTQAMLDVIKFMGDA